MPRIHLLSDLHREFATFQPQADSPDLVVLAGDIDHGTKGLDWARSAFPDLPIVYVAGNHEYYGEAIPHLTDKLRRRGRDLGIHFLENEAVELAGVRILGCTLWTDLRLFGHQEWIVDTVAKGMIDYRSIRVSPDYRRLRPSDTVGWHQKSVRWLREAIPQSALPTIVVTHHAPSALSLAPDLAEDPVSAAYASHLENFGTFENLALWFHGHTHRSVDYRMGGTRVLSNQRGYQDETDPHFDPRLLIQIS